jgi:hypothetical protein
MANDTVIPIKFDKKLEPCEIAALVNHMEKFSELIEAKVDYISHYAVHKRWEKAKETTATAIVQTKSVAAERNG